MHVHAYIQYYLLLVLFNAHLLINRLYARYALRRMRVHVAKRKIRLKDTKTQFAPVTTPVKGVDAWRPGCGWRLTTVAWIRLQIKHPRTKRKISISLFMTVDRMAIDPTVKSDGFLPNHGSDSYGAWCGGCQGPSVHDTRESSAMEPSK